MSIQSEIDRINSNVQSALNAVADTGVSVPEGANSDNLPAAVSALANEKQDKLTGAQGQIVGFGPDGKAVAQDKPTYAASEVGAIPTTEKGAANGVATLGDDGKVPTGQLPAMDYAPSTHASQHASGGADPITPDAIGADASGAAAAVQSNLDVHTGNTTVHITAAERTSWNGKADAPKSVSVTLAAASWDSTAKTQTVTVTGVKASERAQMITPTPALASQTAYYDAGILCTGQAADSLTFTADTIPTVDLTVYVVIQEVAQG